MTEKLFTASIIGVGNIGLRYFQALQKIENIKLIRLYEQDLKSLENRIKYKLNLRVRCPSFLGPLQMNPAFLLHGASSHFPPFLLCTQTSVEP